MFLLFSTSFPPPLEDSFVHVYTDHNAFSRRNLGLSLLVLLMISCQLVSAVDPQPPIFRSNKALDADESKVISGLLFGPRACIRGHCSPIGERYHGGRCCPNGQSRVFFIIGGE